MSATIKDNIVFNYEYDEAFYNLVLDGRSCRVFVLGGKLIELFASLRSET